MTPKTIHSKLGGVVSGVISTRSFFNDDSGKSTEQQNRTPWNQSPCRNGYNDIHILYRFSFFLYSLTMLFVLLTIKWKIKTKNIVNKDLLTIFLVFIFHFKKIYKEYLLPNKGVLQTIFILS